MCWSYVTLNLVESHKLFDGWSAEINNRKYIRFILRKYIFRAWCLLLLFS